MNIYVFKNSLHYRNLFSKGLYKILMSNLCLNVFLMSTQIFISSSNWSLFIDVRMVSGWLNVGIRMHSIWWICFNCNEKLYITKAYVVQGIEEVIDGFLCFVLPWFFLGLAPFYDTFLCNWLYFLSSKHLIEIITW